MLPGLAVAETAPPTPTSINTPDKVESSIGMPEFKDGVPSKETVAKAYDYLDLMHGVGILMICGRSMKKSPQRGARK